ncbi:hypothetical protein Q7W23_09400 [Streptococcus suis]|nr:hypothetical protein [Streptococcus suis]
MKNKFIILLMLCIVTIAPFSSIVVLAEQNNEVSVYSDLSSGDVAILEAELEFYFKEVGYIDGNGVYQITNPNLLLEKAKSGDQNARKLYQGYIASLMRTPYDFAKCVVSNYFGIFIDIANGRLLDALAKDLQSEAWNRAAMTILKLLGKSTSKANVLATAAELAIAAYNCRGKW